MIVDVGSSWNNSVTMSVPGLKSCASDAGDKENRLNTDFASANDKFNLSVENEELKVERLDIVPGGGWGMKLKVGCCQA